MKETVQVTREADAEAFYAESIAAVELHPGTQVVAIDSFRRALARLSATSAPAGVDLDWRRIAKLAGEYGVRYRTNTSLARFLDAVTKPALAAAPAPSVQEVAGEVRCDCCGTHEVDLLRTCHNSDCAKYAIGETVYEGWKNASPAPTVAEPVTVAPAPSCAPATTPPASGVTVPEGMKAWNGDLCAPWDWDPTKPVRYRDGDEDRSPIFWTHDGSRSDIVAYTPAALSTPSATPGEVERAAQHAVRCMNTSQPTIFVQVRRDELQTLVNAALSPQGLDAKEGGE